jgi:hypothetical protein
MQSSVTTTANTQGNNAPAKPTKFQKRIGTTVYAVSVYHSQSSKETIEDKIMRLIENEVRKSA